MLCVTWIVQIGPKHHVRCELVERSCFHADRNFKCFRYGWFICAICIFSWCGRIKRKSHSIQSQMQTRFSIHKCVLQNHNFYNCFRVFHKVRHHFYSQLSVSQIHSVVFSADTLPISRKSIRYCWIIFVWSYRRWLLRPRHSAQHTSITWLCRYSLGLLFVSSLIVPLLHRIQMQNQVVASANFYFQIPSIQLATFHWLPSFWSIYWAWID